MAALRALSLSVPISSPSASSCLCPRLRPGFWQHCLLARWKSSLPSRGSNSLRFSGSRLSFLHFVEVRCSPRSGFFGFATKASAWSADQSPYEILGLEWNVDEDGVKAAYRRMVKQYHPDVFDGSVELGEGETAEARFIKIQAAYELLLDKEQRRQYDYDNRINPLKASKAWMEWIMKKKKAFEQRGDMAVSAWAEQQQREMSLKARRLSKHKMDPEEERRILSREKQASVENFQNTIRRHTLVLKKRDLLRRKADADAQKKLVQQLLAAEGFELADESDDE